MRVSPGDENRAPVLRWCPSYERLLPRLRELVAEWTSARRVLADADLEQGLKVAELERRRVPADMFAASASFSAAARRGGQLALRSAEKGRAVSAAAQLFEACGDGLTKLAGR
jgi:hypothetical protein